MKKTKPTIQSKIKSNRVSTATKQWENKSVDKHSNQPQKQAHSKNIIPVLALIWSIIEFLIDHIFK